MQARVCGDDVAGDHRAFLVFEVRHVAARLAHQDHAGGEIPRRQIALPIDVETPRRDVGKIERGRAETPQARDLVLNDGEFLAELAKIAAPVMRQTAAHDGIEQVLARRYTDAPIVAERALA